MDWIQFSLFAIAMFGMIGWQKKDSQKEYDRMECNLQAIREEVKENAKETRDLIFSIHAAMKDFHGRLCAIEERRK